MYTSSFLIVMSCSDWFLVWLGLEVNMFSFLMLIFNKYIINNVESCLKYFFIQSLGSMFLFIFFYINFNNLYMYSGLILCYKMGGGPFYFWFPSICEGISWWSCFILMSLQKLIPLMLISLMISSFLWVLSFTSLMVGVLGSMNQLKIKRLMAFSSIHHVGWMLMSFMISDLLWLMYMLMYMLMLMSFFSYSQMNMIMNMSQMIQSKNKWMMVVCLLNLGGVPPLMGFYLKWWSFYYIMILDYSLLLVMVVFSLIMLYIYFRMSYDIVLGNVIEIGWLLKYMKSKYIQSDIFVLLSMSMGSWVGLLMVM